MKKQIQEKDSYYIRKKDIKAVCTREEARYYFTQREAISFNTDGFIGFAGWADKGNVNPLLRAFLMWCDVIFEEKKSGSEAITERIPNEEDIS